MEKPSAYQGDDPFIFVCYAHEDAAAVYPEIAWLQAEGVNVWYDEGISLGTEWTEALADAIEGCTKFLFFVTPNSVTREHCRRELNFAQEEGRDVMAVHLQPTEVTGGLRLSLNNRQAIFKHEMADEQYHSEVLQALLGEPVESAAIASPPSSPTRGSRLAIYAAAALLIAVAGAWWFNVAEEDAVEPETATQAEPIDPPKSDLLHNSIAVLPFENLSPDPEHAYFAAGIHGEILNQLGKVRDLSVIARTTMVRYANTGLSIPEIGAELNVGTVMEGSVRYAGERVRITAQLIDTESGTQLWSDAYEENLEDIFGIQLAIASELSRALEAEISPSERASIANASTKNAEAYAYYLRGMSLTGNFAPMGPVHEALEKAIELDPNFAEAYAFNAMMYGFEGGFPQFAGASYSREMSERAFGLAQSNAARALELDPNQAFAYMPLGEYERAYEISPNDYRIVSSVGADRIWMQGRVEEGIELMARSVELAPWDAAGLWYVSGNLFLLQRWDEALRQAQNLVRVAPNKAFCHAYLALVSAFSGDIALARTSARKAESINPGPYAIEDIARAYGRIGDLASAKRVFKEARDTGRAAMMDPYWLFRMHSAAGETDIALDKLEHVVEGGYPRGGLFDLLQRNDHPMFDEVRDDPRFEALVETVAQLKLF